MSYSLPLGLDKISRDRDQAAALSELLHSNAELRAALILAGRELVKLNPGKRDSPALERLRSTLRESAVMDKHARERLFGEIWQ